MYSTHPRRFAGCYGCYSNLRPTTPQEPTVQGNLARKKTPTPLGPPQDPRHRPTEGSWGGAFFESEVPLYAHEPETILRVVLDLVFE